jgi:hypothetical protein
VTKEKIDIEGKKTFPSTSIATKIESSLIDSVYVLHIHHQGNSHQFFFFPFLERRKILENHSLRLQIDSMFLFN